VHTLPFSTERFDLTTAQIVISCTLKNALGYTFTTMQAYHELI